MENFTQKQNLKKNPLAGATLNTQMTVPIDAPIILVVDDDESMRELIQLALENAAFQVVTAQNGSEAIDRLKSVAGVAMIILDVQMPIMNGNEVLEEMRLGGYLDKIPVLIVSATDKVDEHNEVFQIITKPISMEYLVDSVKRCLKTF